MYLPKLMPAIPEGRKDISISTNIGIPINVNYNSFVKISSSITARALDADEQLPDIGSKVGIIFFEGQADLCFWFKINVNFDYTVIPEEKYPSYFSLQVGNKFLNVNKDDFVKIVFEDENEIVLIEKDKEKEIKILKPKNTDERIKKLEDKIGIKSGISENVNAYGDIVYEEVTGYGLLSEVENLKKQVEELQSIIRDLNFSDSLR